MIPHLCLCFLQSCNKSLINQACSGPYWENIGPRSFLHGPPCARSVLSIPRADILPVRPSRLVKGLVKKYRGGGGGPEQRGGGSSVFKPLERGGSFDFPQHVGGGSF